MIHLDRDGIKLAHVEAGSGDPTLVFVPGWCSDHSFFAPQFEHFQGRHRVVAIDQRGFGASDKPEQTYSIEGWGDDLVWRCGELGIEHAVVIGHSMGGAVALAAAADHPDLFCAAVLCDPAVLPPAGVSERWNDLVEAFRGPEYRKAARDFIAQVLFIPSDDPQRKEQLTEQMTAVEQRILHSTFAAIPRFDSDAAAGRCRVPVLNIDAAHPIPDLRRFRELCPTLVTGQTVGAGHFHQLEVPGQVNAMIERFLLTSLV